MTKPDGAAHEALLLAAMASIPDLLAKTLQTSDPLNAVLLDNRQELERRAEELISSGELPEYMHALLRAAAHVKFAAPEVEAPEVKCGIALSQTYDARGKRKPVPSLLQVVDMSVKLHVPRFGSVGFKSKYSLADRAAHPSAPADVLDTHLYLDELTAHFGVYERTVALGDVVRAMAELDHAAHIEPARDPRVHARVVAVIERPELFDPIATAHDVILIQQGSIVDYALDSLLKIHSAPAGLAKVY